MCVPSRPPSLLSCTTPPHRALTAFLLLYHRNPHRRPPAGAPGTPSDCPDRSSPATTSQDRNVQCRPGHQTLREKQLEIDLAEKMEIIRRRSDADYLTNLENQGGERFFVPYHFFTFRVTPGSPIHFFRNIGKPGRYSPLFPTPDKAKESYMSIMLTLAAYRKASDISGKSLPLLPSSKVGCGTFPL